MSDYLKNLLSIKGPNTSEEATRFLEEQFMRTLMDYKWELNNNALTASFLLKVTGHFIGLVKSPL